MKPAPHTYEPFLQCRIFTEHRASENHSTLRSRYEAVSAEHKSSLGACTEQPCSRPGADPPPSNFRFHSGENEPSPVQKNARRGRLRTVRPRRGPSRPNHLRARTGIRRPHAVHFGRVRIKENSSGSEKGPGSTSGPGTEVWREGCRGGRPGAIPPSPRGSRGPQRGPAGLPTPGPGVGLGQRAAAQAGAPPGGAQSPALTQLKAGAGAPPFWRPLPSHSPAEVIMAAPCTRLPVRSPSGPRSVSVSPGPTSSAAPPHCPGALLSQSPPRAAGSLLDQDPVRPGLPTASPAARHEFSPGLRLPRRHRRPGPRRRMHRERHCFL